MKGKICLKSKLLNEIGSMDILLTDLSGHSLMENV